MDKNLHISSLKAFKIYFYKKWLILAIPSLLIFWHGTCVI